MNRNHAIRTFVIKVFLFVALQSGIGIYLLQRYPPDRGTYMSATIDKHDLLNRQASPRIIFVGGSGVAFGMRCDLVERATTYHPINMGLHAGLGLRFMLNEVEPALRPGDFVVLIPEFEHFRVPSDFWTTQMQAIEQRWSSALYIPAADVPAALDRALPFGLRQLGNVFHKLPESPASTLIPYARGSFNVFGDETVHFALPDRPVSEARLRTDFDVPQTDALRTIALLNSFNQRCQAKSVTVLFSYPAIPQVRYQARLEKFQAFSDLMDRELKILRLTTIAELAYPSNYFWDSDYHLNKIGATRRTQLLIERLSRPRPLYIGLTTVYGMDTHIPIPDYNIADGGWGLYPGTRFQPDAEMTGPCELQVDALSLFPSRILIVKAGGNEIFRQTFSELGKIYSMRVPMTIKSGDFIDFEYGGNGPVNQPPQLPLAILFSALHLRQLPPK